MSSLTSAPASASGWTNSGNVLASDNVYATNVVSTVGSLTAMLKAIFSLSVPVGATINGITVAIERKADSAGIAFDDTVQLARSGVAVGSNKASASLWPTSDAVANYGTGTTDLWGTTWTVAQVNALEVWVRGTTNNDGVVTFSIDQITVTVYYTGGSATVTRHIGGSHGGISKDIGSALARSR